MVLEGSSVPWASRRGRTGVGRCAPRPARRVEAEGTTSRDESFTAWRRFWESLAERHPLVLVFEDVRIWADEGLLDFVEHLAEWSRGVPILLVCTARPELFERRAGWGGGKLNSLTLALSLRATTRPNCWRSSCNAPSSPPRRKRHCSSARARRPALRRAIRAALSRARVGG